MRRQASAHATCLAALLLPALALSACSLLLDADSPACPAGKPCQTAGSTVSSSPSAGGSGSGEPAGSGEPVESSEPAGSGEPAESSEPAESGEPDDECETDADCASDMARCDPERHRCVECLHNDDCPMAVCDTARHVCEGCLSNDDCKDPNFAHCNPTGKECAGCLADGDCERFYETPVCEKSKRTCVQCTAEAENACNGNVCDLDMHRCSALRRGATALCERCRWDSECPGGTMPVTQRDAACVPMTFKDSPHGNYCLRRHAKDCMPPYMSQTKVLISTSQAMEQPYCGVAQEVTTCEAVRALGAATCPSGDETRCGAPDVDDAVCETVNGVANQCTYPCSAPTECPAGYMCTDGYCQ